MLWKFTNFSSEFVHELLCFLLQFVAFALPFSHEIFLSALSSKLKVELDSVKTWSMPDLKRGRDWVSSVYPFDLAKLKIKLQEWTIRSFSLKWCHVVEQFSPRSLLKQEIWIILSWKCMYVYVYTNSFTCLELSIFLPTYNCKVVE